MVESGIATRSKALLHTYKNDIVVNIIQHNTYAVKVKDELWYCLDEERIDY